MIATGHPEPMVIIDVSGDALEVVHQSATESRVPTVSLALDSADSVWLNLDQATSLRDWLSAWIVAEKSSDCGPIEDSA